MVHVGYGQGSVWMPGTCMHAAVVVDLGHGSRIYRPEAVHSCHIHVLHTANVNQYAAVARLQLTIEPTYSQHACMHGMYTM